MELKCLTTKEVARLCRVSDATVKRWEAAGFLQSERTSGGHRRFRVGEIARFQREQKLGLKISHGDESAASPTTRRRHFDDYSNCALFKSLIAGCEEAAANCIIAQYLDDKPLAEIFDNLVCPAMRRIGELWLKGNLSITQEHIATRTAAGAIYKLRGILPVSGAAGELAMCCAMEGDFHELPAHLAQMTIENEGWEVINFGANTPLYCLAEEMTRHTPRMICLAATIIGDVERLSRDYKIFFEQANRHKIPVVLGGRAFADESVRQRFYADYYVRSFAEVAELTRRFSQIH